MKATRFTMFCLAATLFAAGCSKSSKNNTPAEVDPSDPNALQSVLVVPGGSLKSGNPPPPTNTPDAPVTEDEQASASISPGNQIYLPFSFTSQAGYTKCYVQVQGATNGYFEIPANSTVNSGTMAIPINIPSNVLTGTFCVMYCIQDAQGRVSNIMTTCITLRDPIDCSNAMASGSDGLTFTQVEMGDNAGSVEITYDTYSIPDRIDVYQGSKWLTGTGNDPQSLVPPIADCDDVVPGDGFVGANDVLTFNYNPSQGKTITVVASGCIGSGTAWDWSMICPN